MRKSAVKMRITRLIKVIDKYNKNQNYILVSLYSSKLDKICKDHQKELLDKNM